MALRLIGLTLVSFLAGLGPVTSDPNGAITKTLLVTVLDQAGEPLRDLDARDFIVTEDGVRREVAYAWLSEAPLFVALLVDTARPIPGVPYPTQDLRRALSAFGLRILAGAPESEIAIFDVAVAGSVMVPSTTRLDAIETWITRLVPSQQASGVLLETMTAAARQLAKKPSPRRAIVSITFDSPESDSVPPETVEDVVLKSGAAYWPVSVRGAGTGAAQGLYSQQRAMSPTREALFAALPGPTGGLRVTAVSATGLESMLRRVAEALTAQYEVTYMRPDGATPKVIDAGARRGAKVLRAPWVR